MSESKFAVIYFENDIGNPTEWNKKIKHDNTLISLDLFNFGFTGFTPEGEGLMGLFPFQKNNPDWYSFESEITGDELLGLIGHTFEEAREKCSFLSSMVEWRKEHDGEGYTQIVDIEAFFKEAAKNSIKKVVLHLSENP